MNLIWLHAAVSLLLSPLRVWEMKSDGRVSALCLGQTVSGSSCPAWARASQLAGAEDLGCLAGRVRNGKQFEIIGMCPEILNKQSDRLGLGVTQRWGTTGPETEQEERGKIPRVSAGGEVYLEWFFLSYRNSRYIKGFEHIYAWSWCLMCLWRIRMTTCLERAKRSLS